MSSKEVNEIIQNGMAQVLAQGVISQLDDETKDKVITQAITNSLDSWDTKRCAEQAIDDLVKARENR